MDKKSTCIFLNPLFSSAVDISPLPLSNLENSSLISLSGFLLDLMLSSTICVWGGRGIGVLCQKGELKDYTIDIRVCIDRSAMFRTS